MDLVPLWVRDSVLVWDLERVFDGAAVELVDAVKDADAVNEAEAVRDGEGEGDGPGVHMAG